MNNTLGCPVADTHVHLWDTDRFDYGWLRRGSPLHRPFLPEHFTEASANAGVTKIVFVEAAAEPQHGLDEVAWVSGLAARDTRIQGIVARVPLENGLACRPHLKALAANPLVKGVRRIYQGNRDPGFCLRPDFADGLSMLPEFGFTFDICISHVQLPNTIRLVEQFPDVSFVLDHIAKPDIRNARYEPWKTDLRVLADLPNVVCKLSGMVTEADHENWRDGDLRPYIDHVIDCFGFDRVMFGSDWPVCTLACEYGRWLDCLCGALSGACAEEKRKLFLDNALRAYRLPL